VAVTILDGGMGRQLERMGAPFRQPEWSALALLEAPEWVGRAHRAFIDAGADVITTNTYAVVPFHIGAERFAARARELADVAGRVAREEADAAPSPVLVAGSLPPVFGSYRPDLYDVATAPALLAPLVAGLAPHVDLWLAETQSLVVEAETALAALPADGRPRWVSFTLRDEVGPPLLRSGEDAGAAAVAAVAAGAAAVLFNCSQPERMAAAIGAARRAVADEIALGAYANAFPALASDHRANDGLTPIRADLDPAGYLAFARTWVETGATLIGGCCGIGPEQIGVLADQLRR
jgi:S-methylmethionine-dependent homocysteine/selenocysteine methylase